MGKSFLISFTLLGGVFLFPLTGSAQTPITGFQINKIEGTGHLKGLVNDRLTKDYKVNFNDCLLYMQGVEATTVDQSPDRLNDSDVLVQPETFQQSDTQGFKNSSDASHSPSGPPPPDVAKVPRILIKWSLSPVQGYSYSIKVGNCPESGGIDDTETESCRYLVRLEALTSYSNNEVTVDLRDLIDDKCTLGEVGDASLYFFIQRADETYTKQVSSVKFRYDYDAPEPPYGLTLEPGEDNIRVSWEDELNSPEVTYNVYYATQKFDEESLDVAEVKKGVTSKTLQIKELEVGKTYYIGVTAVDDFDNESPLSEVLSEMPISIDDFWEHYRNSGGREEGGFCFIATAAWGTPMARSVALLRSFRDNVLVASPWGRAFVSFYYRYGPKAAEFIRGKPALRFGARILLAPAVAVAWFTVGIQRAVRNMLLAALAMLIIVIWLRRAATFSSSVWVSLPSVHRPPGRRRRERRAR